VKRIGLLLIVVLLGACSKSSDKPAPVSEPAAPSEAPGETAPKAETKPKASTPPRPNDPYLFSDITSDAGISFKHFNDASPRKYLPETMGAGVAFFDYDNDGRPDLFFVNGARLRSSKAGSPTCALYRNVDGFTFSDVTVAAGLSDPIFGMGAAVGDIDNDGFLDLFVSGVDEDRLYRNRGDGTFENVGRKMGLSNVGFSSSAAFLDYDRDGYLDLLVGRYVEWSAETDIICSPDGVHQTYCTPESYKGATNRLYKNIGGKRLRDVTRTAGLWYPDGKTLGIAILDYNRDSWPDIAVANDTVRNYLFVNNRDGSFSEVGVMSGMAYSESGATRGGMGIDASDADADGYWDIVVGNFSQEMSAFYRGSEKGFFQDEAPQVGIGLATLMTLAFGTLFLDFDNDGALDVVIANGHIEPEISKTQRLQQYAQPLHVFRNTDNTMFRPVEDHRGSPLHMPLVGRGLAYADIDTDGDLDLAVTQNGRAAKLLRNNAKPRSWIRVQLTGSRSNRVGYGTTVKAIDGARSWTRVLTSGRSYLSACEPVLTIGLGNATALDRLEITWPSGAVQKVEKPAIKQLLVVKEPPISGT